MSRARTGPASSRTAMNYASCTRIAAALVVPCGLSFGLMSSIATVEGFTTTYAEGKSFTVAVQMDSETTSERSMTMDGEPVEGRGGGGPTTRSTAFGFDHTDMITSVTDGAPMKLTREFGEVSASTSADRGGEAQEREMDSPFPGVKLVLESTDGEVEVTLDGEDEVVD